MDYTEIQELLDNSDRLKGWKVERLIGEGRSGRVYAIRRDAQYGGVCERSALKWVRICPTEQERLKCPELGMTEEDLANQYKERIDARTPEIRIMMDLQGETNIVNYQDYEIQPISDGIGWDIFIRMELLTALDDYIAHEGVSVEMIVDVGRSISAALSLCHHFRPGSPIIHGDVKPENIFFAREHSYKLGDFGLSFLEIGDGNEKPGGTRGYLAPECVSGGKKTVYSDQYALGMVLKELCARIDGNDSAQLRRGQIDRQCRDEQLLRIVDIATREDPAKRYSDIDDMLKELNSIRNPSDVRIHLESAGGHAEARNPDRTMTDVTQNDAVNADDDLMAGIVTAIEDQKESEQAQQKDEKKSDTIAEEERIKREEEERRKKENRKKRIRRICLIAAGVAILATACVFGPGLLHPPESDKLFYGDHKTSLYNYTISYVNKLMWADDVPSSGWDSVFSGNRYDDNHVRPCASLSANIGTGTGYVLLLLPGNEAMLPDLKGHNCRVKLKTRDTMVAEVSGECGNRDSMLTKGSKYLYVDLLPVITAARDKASFMQGDAYEIRIYLDGKLLIVVRGVFA